MRLAWRHGEVGDDRDGVAVAADEAPELVRGHVAEVCGLDRREGACGEAEGVGDVFGVYAYLLCEELDSG